MGSQTRANFLHTEMYWINKTSLFVTLKISRHFNHQTNYHLELTPKLFSLTRPPCNKGTKYSLSTPNPGFSTSGYFSFGSFHLKVKDERKKILNVKDDI